MPAARYSAIVSAGTFRAAAAAGARSARRGISARARSSTARSSSGSALSSPEIDTWSRRVMGFASGMRPPLPPFHPSGSACIRDGGYARGRGRIRRYSALWNDMTRRQTTRRADAASLQFDHAPKVLTRTGWLASVPPSASRGDACSRPLCRPSVPSPATTAHAPEADTHDHPHERRGRVHSGFSRIVQPATTAKPKVDLHRSGSSGSRRGSSPCRTLGLVAIMRWWPPNWLFIRGIPDQLGLTTADDGKKLISR